MHSSSLHARRAVSRELPVRLHDVATGLAIGISYLKASAGGEPGGINPNTRRASELLEESLAQLRRLISATADEADLLPDREGLVGSITREAKRLNLRLELEINGKEAWLAPNHAELVWLVGREALRNVSRHSGSSACRIQIDLTTCPFAVHVRDWGGGLRNRAKPGDGLGLLQKMAASMRCRLDVGSQPGFGTDLVLIGPPCANERDRLPTAGAGPSASTRESPTRRHKTQNGRQSAVDLASTSAD